MKNQTILKTLHQKITWALHLTPKEFFAYLNFRKTQITQYFKRKNLIKSKKNFLKKLESPSHLKKLTNSHNSTKPTFFFKTNKNLIKALTPYKQTILKEAEKILNHKFILLGSKPTKLKQKINWHQDFKSGKTWPLNLATEIPYEFSTSNDIKVPWDLSRGLQFPTLGQAYLLTNNSKYAHEFEAQITDWIKSNPLHFGVNWKCTMDVAIRACNWTFGWQFFKNSPNITEKFKTLFYNSLHQHGEFIIHNLETFPFTSNHYLSDIVGLVYLGIMFPQFKASKKWRKKGIKALEEEMKKQVYKDGADFEASISYHRLATELFAYSAILCKLNNHKLSFTFWQQLEKMFNYTLNYTKPNNLAPMIGDFDDGRLHILSNFSNWNKRDHTYLLSIANILFPNETQYSSFTKQPHETILLTQNISETSSQQQSTNLKSIAFPNTGTYSLRSKKTHIFINAGPNGQNKNGGHSHNDTFSFEINKEKKDFIIDTGSFIYTPDLKARDHFRSTKMHNTLCIDNTEINPIDPKQPFYLKEAAHPKVLTWKTTKEKDILKAQHTSYHRLDDPITHQRTFSFEKATSHLEITDTLIGNGPHTLEWNFHFTPETNLKLNSNKLTATQKNTTLTIEFPQELTTQIKETEVSYSYGIKEKSKRLTLSAKIKIDSKKVFLFIIR